MLRCPDKQRLIADPKLDLEPATKLTERLAAGTVYGNSPIDGQSENPRTNSGPAIGEKAW